MKPRTRRVRSVRGLSSVEASVLLGLAILAGAAVLAFRRSPLDALSLLILSFVGGFSALSLLSPGPRIRTAKAGGVAEAPTKSAGDAGRRAVAGVTALAGCQLSAPCHRPISESEGA